MLIEALPHDEVLKSPKNHDAGLLGLGRRGASTSKLPDAKVLVIQKGRDTGIIYNEEKTRRRDMVDLPDSW